MDDLLDFNVNQYEKAPSGNEHLFRQIEMASERLKLYRVFQAHENLTAEELKTFLDSPLKLLLEPSFHEGTMSARRMDFIGHWTLRVAYSVSYPTLFIKNESRWFKMRFNNMSLEDRRKFVKKNKVELTEATGEEMAKFELRGKWYKVDYARVPFLVRQRIYPLNVGHIFIPEHKIGFLLLEQLEKHLKDALIHAKKMLSQSSDQLKFILSMLDLVKPYRYLGGNTLKLEDLETNVKHFPLCMKLQHETLTQNHHLKHKSRFQYGLFLKGIGLSLDDSLRMWQNEFTKRMTEKRFVAEYSYFFKHIYGTVGNKINYHPQSCGKILEDDPSPSGGVNGCPYKNWDEEILSEKLREDGISDADIGEILVLKKDRKYKEACTRCFRCLHNSAPKEIITHPVMFFEKSCSVGLVDIEDLFASDSE